MKPTMSVLNPDEILEQIESLLSYANEWDRTDTYDITELVSKLNNHLRDGGALPKAWQGSKRKNDSAPNKLKIVYVITQKNGRSFWDRIGVAFVNSDGSLNVKLNALPVGGEMHIRDYVPREERTPKEESAPRGHNYGDPEDDIPF